jgi:hypothetical protein
LKDGPDTTDTTRAVCGATRAKGSAATRVDNVSRRWHALHAVPVAAALCCALVSVGIVSRPAASLAEARRAEAGARRRALETRAAQQELARFEDAGGLDRLAELEGRLAAAFPERPSAVELYAALVLAARASGVALTDVHLGGTVATELELLDHELVLHEALVSGRARLGALTDLVAGLEECGYPVVVRRAALERGAAHEVEFGFALELALVGRAPRAARTGETDGGGRVP